jgi:hypothetical protein
MPEFAVYITDHSEYPDSDDFYLLEASTAEDALETARQEVRRLAQNWGPLYIVQFAIPAGAALLAVDAGGPVTPRKFEELSGASRPHP